MACLPLLRIDNTASELSSKDVFTWMSSTSADLSHSGLADLDSVSFAVVETGALLQAASRPRRGASFCAQRAPNHRWWRPRPALTTGHPVDPKAMHVARLGSADEEAFPSGDVGRERWSAICPR